jgi:electron transfer flavoprotein alpha subunit
MAVLVIAEHDGSALKPATLSAVAAAGRLAGPIDLLVAGSGSAAIASAAAAIPGVARVLHADAPAYANRLAETVAPLIASLASGYSHVIAADTTFGKNVLPRAAALADSQQISEAIEIIDADTFVRPIYAGNALATVRSADAIKFVTIRATNFDAVAATGGSAAIEEVSGGADAGRSRFIKAELQVSERPELTAARVVVSGGRGMQNGENFAMLEKLADKLGGAVGASRAAVDAGFVPNDYQVGQTGKVVAPDLYIAVGISGAIQHLAGMKDSKVIVAINKDEEAPIFSVADYGLVGDLFKVIPDLQAELEKSA